jgi:hypothetical protein
VKPFGRRPSESTAWPHDTSLPDADGLGSGVQTPNSVCAQPCLQSTITARPAYPERVGYSNDVEKMERWSETVTWATSNGCPDIVNDITGPDFYFVERPSSYLLGPLGGPMYRPWDAEAKTRSSTDDLARYLATLILRWQEIVGLDIGRATRPLAFTGRKARRLLVRARIEVRPLWGSWFHLSDGKTERRKFTTFRASINTAIAPHEVDHIDFVPE